MTSAIIQLLSGLEVGFVSSSASDRDIERTLIYETVVLEGGGIAIADKNLPVRMGLAKRGRLARQPCVLAAQSLDGQSAILGEHPLCRGEVEE